MALRLPQRRNNKTAILEQLRKAKEKDVNWKDGKVFSLVFYAGEEIYSVIKEAYNMFFSENGLNPSAFPSLKKFETEVVGMVAGLLNGDKHVTGNMTSGGTESILLAMYTAREWARQNKPHIKKPEVVAPLSAHPAFDKAAHYFDIKLIHIPGGPDFRADVRAMEAAITENTIMLIGSAPQYAQGVVDPIYELGQIALKRKILLHTDACVGGMMLPFVKKLGYEIPAFDFSVPGVTSMSVDLHKYGYAAKGASVVLYKNKQLRRHQFFVYTGWPGGIYGSPGILGTRAGGSIAAAWAVLNYLGEEGYLEINDKVMKTATWLKDQINQLPGIRILGKPHGCVMAIGADTSEGQPEIDIFQLGDELAVRGWHLDKQQDPSCLHLTINFAHTVSKEKLIRDLKDGLRKVMGFSWHKFTAKLQVGLVKGLTKIMPASWFQKLSKAQGKMQKNIPKRSAAMYGMMGSLPNKGDIDDMVIDFLDKLYTVPKK